MALEGRGVVYHLADIEAAETAGILVLRRGFMSEQSCADSAHNFMVGRDDYIGFKLLPQRPDNPLIKGNPTLKHDGGLYILTGADIAQIVTHQSAA